MDKAGDALGRMLRQAIMTREEYNELREDDRIWKHLLRPLPLLFAATLFILVILGAVVSLHIVFPPGGGTPFCSRNSTPISNIMDGSMHSFYFTEYEAAQYFFLVAFVPAFLIFGISGLYLIAGMIVAYSAPDTHACIKVVENNCCASRRGGVRCLATINVSFAIVFTLMALFLGSSILTLQTDCSQTLFWCYEMICWGFAFLYGGTYFSLRRKAAVIMDEGEYYGSRTMGMELLGPSGEPPSPGMIRRTNAGFNAWMGPAISSSDDEDELAVGHKDFSDDLYHGEDMGVEGRQA